MRLSSDRVKVSVPGSVEGLGPATGALALAVGPRDEITVRAVAGGTQVRIVDRTPRRVPERWLPADEVEEHPTIRAMRAVLEAVGAPQIGIHLTYRCAQPDHCGLGELEAEILAGLFAAWTLLGKPSNLGPDRLLELGASLGGDPLRMRVSLEGGLILRLAPVGGAPGSVNERVPERWIQLMPASAIAPVALIPPVTPLGAVDDLLPSSVSLRRHLANVARVASLATLLTMGHGGGPLGVDSVSSDSPAAEAVQSVDGIDVRGKDDPDPEGPQLVPQPWKEMLAEATIDEVLEEYRESFAPASVALIRWLRQRGIAAFLSGSGPAVVCLWELEAAVRRDAVEAGWTVFPLSLDDAGLCLDM